MSSSKSKGKETNGNSKINHKDEMPKVVSKTESNIKGARPKTSSKPEKSNKDTAAKQQPLVSVKTDLKVLIMNASGPSQGDEPSTRRKQAIQNVINKHNPDLVLLQEFSWKGIHGKIWLAHPVPEHYQLTGNTDASILYNINELIVEENPTGKLQRILEELQRPTSKHPTPVPLKFAPIPRMSLRMVKTKGVPVIEFICISWHGRHKGIDDLEKVIEFRHLMIFVKDIRTKNKNLPILLAGDFNVDMELISHEVEDPFKLHEYKASKRRKKKGVIDYFIATTELCLKDIKPVDLKKDSIADKPEDVLDHDPIIAMLEPSQLSTAVPTPDKTTVKMSKKAK
ncbi:hypothetical protein CHS0354_028680 [Potamilus streckersoni]|uniref:Endonuclease/exonuclease/phosphatase domain-containing protein n=1 Tax=Potamilus streckersoni TaxID=2493646 RepID=A0AAE0SWZ1_9BIVA|nr:hypothetical protein CHS0354_028680 [Potamilus streckersoni]